MSLHPSFIRHQRLAQKNWGPCDECGKRRAEFYAIWNMSPQEPGMCVCGECVGSGSEEVPEDFHMYNPRHPVKCETCGFLSVFVVRPQIVVCAQCGEMAATTDPGAGAKADGDHLRTRGAEGRSIRQPEQGVQFPRPGPETSPSHSEPDGEDLSHD